jgi:hypothetical protein
MRQPSRQGPLLAATIILALLALSTLAPYPARKPNALGYFSLCP